MKIDGRKLADLFRGKGYSQNGFAASAGIDRGTLSKIVNGIVEPTPAHLGWFAAALGMGVEDLAERTGATLGDGYGAALKAQRFSLEARLEEFGLQLEADRAVTREAMAIMGEEMARLAGEVERLEVERARLEVARTEQAKRAAVMVAEFNAKMREVE